MFVSSRGAVCHVQSTIGLQGTTNSPTPPLTNTVSGLKKKLDPWCFPELGAVVVMEDDPQELAVDAKRYMMPSRQFPLTAFKE
jgi:hypothetical protein